MGLYWKNVSGYTKKKQKNKPENLLFTAIPFVSNLTYSMLLILLYFKFRQTYLPNQMCLIKSSTFEIQKYLFGTIIDL